MSSSRISKDEVIEIAKSIMSPDAISQIEQIDVSYKNNGMFNHPHKSGWLVRITYIDLGIDPNETFIEVYEDTMEPVFFPMI